MEKKWWYVLSIVLIALIVLYFSTSNISLAPKKGERTDDQKVMEEKTKPAKEEKKEQIEILSEIVESEEGTVMFEKMFAK